MENKIKITSLQLENVKRIKVVNFEPTEQGLNIIGGDNCQGKSSVLDAIAWTLGGAKFAPSNPQNNNTSNPPETKIVLSNGLTVERFGKNSSLKITDTQGKKAGQELLNEFISSFALDLPKFMNATDKEKAFILLESLGIKSTLQKLEDDEQKIYDERTLVGRELVSAKKYAEQLPFFETILVLSNDDIIKKQNEAIALNNANAQTRRNYQNLLDSANLQQSQLSQISEKIIQVQKELEDLKNSYNLHLSEARTTQKNLESTVVTLSNLPLDVDLTTFAEDFKNVEIENSKQRANAEKQKATKAAELKQKEYDDLTTKIVETRNKILQLINGANLPLKGLTVENSILLYNNQKWDCMSGAERLTVAACIVKSINPQCGFILMDNFEAFDLNTLKVFNQWCKSQDLQVIATRVSQGEECSIIIENGEIK